SSASRAGRGGTSASRYAATRGATRFILSLPRQSSINRQVAQRRRLLPRLLVQPRQVEVRVRQPPIGGDRLLVGLHRVVGPPPGGAPAAPHARPGSRRRSRAPAAPNPDSRRARRLALPPDVPRP